MKTVWFHQTLRRTVGLHMIPQSFLKEKLSMFMFHKYLIRHLLHFRGRIWICVHIFGQEANEHLKLGHYMFPKCKRKTVRSIFVALEIKRCLQKIQMRLFNHSLSTTTAQLARRESNLENYRIALTLICFYGHIN